VMMAIVFERRRSVVDAAVVYVGRHGDGSDLHGRLSHLKPLVSPFVEPYHPGRVPASSEVT